MPCAENNPILSVYRTANKIHVLSKRRSGGPFPVKYFRKWEDVGVGEDHRDTSCLQHVAEGSLAEPGPPQNHTEGGILWRHIRENVNKTWTYTTIQIWEQFFFFLNVLHHTCRIWG